MLLAAIVGPNYAGALKTGDVPEQIDRCQAWVKAEASEAASLIDSCVPHGKPMLARLRNDWRDWRRYSCWLVSPASTWEGVETPARGGRDHSSMA